MRFLLICGGLLILSGCTPFVDARREAGVIGTVGQSKAEAPAVCYNPLWSSLDSVQQLAQSVCQKNKQTAVFERKEAFSCCLFYPTTAYYKCQ